MERKYEVKKDYLCFPVCINQDEELIMISLVDDQGKQKVFEFMIPIDWKKEGEYTHEFMAEIPVREYKGKTLLIEGNAPEAFFNAIVNTDETTCAETVRPRVHFTAQKGWINDPNGLVYKDGVYHLFFQMNPFDVRWKNMSWGHAVSKDLLHWEQQDLAMWADEDGEMFSGCGLKNDREMLDLPKDALLFFYTAAGGFANWSKGTEFTQKISYSLDGGKTLQKIKEPCIPIIYHDSRDPKVFWHEESNSYVMVLWLRGSEFAIFRSADLKNWEQQQVVYLDGGYECPDLMRLYDPEGREKWFFWAADGRYYPGEFDGFHFTNTGEMHMAYLTDLPYAAQTYAGIGDRTISVPWLRMPNDGRLFTGAMGIPLELSYVEDRGLSFMVQKPVREFYQSLEKTENFDLSEGEVSYQANGDTCALYVRVEIDPYVNQSYEWKIGGSEIEYNPCTGELRVDGKGVRTRLECKTIEFIVDDKILEMIFEDGRAMGTFLLRDNSLTFRMKTDRIKEYEVSVIR